MADKQPDPFDMSAGVPAIEGAVRPTPKYADRISKRVLMVGFGIVALMVVIFFASLDAMDRSKQDRKDKAEAQAKKAGANKPSETVAPKELVEGPDAAGNGKVSLVGAGHAQDAGSSSGWEGLLGGAGNAPSLMGVGAPPSAAPPASATQVPGLNAAGGNPRHSGLLPVDDGLGSGDVRADSSRQHVKVLTPAEQAEQQAQAERLKRMQAARVNGLVAASYSGSDKGPAAAGTPQAASALLASLAGQAGLGGGTPGQAHAGVAQGGQRGGDSEQDQKAQFIKTAGSDRSNYLQSSQMPAVSPNEVKRGSYIPLRLEVAINSGQPGMVRARVTEDVYDTITGCRLLIPALTTVQGMYDSRVAVGQTRNLVVWNYMGFEDGSDLSLGSMQGYDSSGAAGIEADVENHYGRLFALAFGMSMVTAGVQQSVAPPPANNTGMSTQQAIATSLAQQYGQLGAQILGKQMQVQPTLRNYPGERFVIMTPSTIVFKKVWRNRCQ